MRRRRLERPAIETPNRIRAFPTAGVEPRQRRRFGTGSRGKPGRKTRRPHPRPIRFGIFGLARRSKGVGKRTGIQADRAPPNLPFGTWQRLHFCRQAVQDYARQPAFLCGSGVLPPLFEVFCADRPEIWESAARRHRADEHVPQLFPRRTEHRGRRRPGRHRPLCGQARTPGRIRTRGHVKPAFCLEIPALFSGAWRIEGSVGGVVEVKGDLIFKLEK